MPTKRLKELRITLGEAVYWTERLAAFALGLAWDEWDKLQIRRAQRHGLERDLLPCRCDSCCEARKSVVA